MKIAVVKIGGRISLSGGVSPWEAYHITNYINGAYSPLPSPVSPFTSIVKNDKTPWPRCINHPIDISEGPDRINDFDALVVINGSINFFGGVIDEATINTYKTISKFKGKLFYVYVDTLLPFKQLWPMIENRHGHNIKKEDVWIDNDATYISQFYNIEETKKIIEKTSDIPLKDIKHLQISNIAYYENEQHEVVNPEYDLAYGGSFRAGKRANDLLKFYFNTGGSSYLFGSITPNHFKKKIEGFTEDQMPVFGKRVKYHKVGEEARKARATIIIGDETYKKLDNIPMRVFEAIRAGTIVFIDETYDVNRRIFKDNTIAKGIKNFSYVKDGKEAIEKLNSFDKKVVNSIPSLQRALLNIENKEDFLQKLREIIDAPEN